MVTDLRLIRFENGENDTLLLDLPASGEPAALTHLGRYLPPRMAKLSEREQRLGMISVVGPMASSLLTSESLLPVDPEELTGSEEGAEWTFAESGDGPLVIRTTDVIPLAFDVIADLGRLEEIVSTLVGLGVTRADESLWDVLRLERGRPAFGAEMDEDTMPAEAGIVSRAIDQSKGCYTGQEVVVRIRDRGHVNRRLRGVLLGDTGAADGRTPLFQDDREAPVGELRSFALSPRFGQGIGLAYVRREIEPPARLRLAQPSGPIIAIRELSDEGWVLVEGDPTFYP